MPHPVAFVIFAVQKHTVVKRIKRHYRKARYVLYRETMVDAREHLLAFFGGFSGIACIGLLSRQLIGASDTLFLIGSFGASAVLVYGIINSPLAQPRNLIGGHLVSAVIGVTVCKFCPGEAWFQSALAVSLAIVVMQITKTLHPPGGATALIATIGSAKVKDLGYYYVLSPVLSGVLILLIVALIVNNISGYRRYPLRRNRGRSGA